MLPPAPLETVECFTWFKLKERAAWVSNAVDIGSHCMWWVPLNGILGYLP